LSILRGFKVKQGLFDLLNRLSSEPERSAVPLPTCLTALSASFAKTLVFPLLLNKLSESTGGHA